MSVSTRLRPVRRLLVLLAVSELVLVGCGAASGTLAGPAVSSTSPAGGDLQGPPPDRVTVQGVPLKLNSSVPFLTAQVSQDDPATVIVIGGEHAPGKPNPCTSYTLGRLLAENDASVRIGLYEYRTAGTSSGEVACPAIGYPPEHVAVKLKRPFGSRKLISDAGGATVPVSNPRALFRATELPAGYHQPGQLEVQRRDSGQIVNLTTYAGPDANTTLMLVEGPPSAVEPPDNQQILQQLSVRGHPATFQQTVNFPDVRCLRWRERPDLALAACSRGNPAGPLTVRKLSRVADYLTTGA